MLIWLGDFNYRVDCTYSEALEYIQHGWIKELLAKVRRTPFIRTDLDCALICRSGNWGAFVVQEH